MYISKGNIKLSGNQFLIWNLPAQKTCPGCTKTCTSKCYAKKAERLYRGVLACREQNLTDSKQEIFVSSLISEIQRMTKRKSYKYFRIHESGDFYSQEYLDKWFEICRAFPDIRFLAFTKSFSLDFSQKPDNLQVIYSIWNDTKADNIPSNGLYSYAGDCTAIAGERYEKAFECAGHCDKCQFCWNPTGDVRFHIH